MWLKQFPNVTSEDATREDTVGNSHVEPACTDEKHENEEPEFQDQSSRMPLKKILIVYLGIGEEAKLIRNHYFT